MYRQRRPKTNYAIRIPLRTSQVSVTSANERFIAAPIQFSHELGSSFVWRFMQKGTHPPFGEPSKTHSGHTITSLAVQLSRRLIHQKLFPWNRHTRLKELTLPNDRLKDCLLQLVFTSSNCSRQWPKDGIQFHRHFKSHHEPRYTHTPIRNVHLIFNRFKSRIYRSLYQRMHTNTAMSTQRYPMRSNFNLLIKKHRSFLFSATGPHGSQPWQRFHSDSFQVHRTHDVALVPPLAGALWMSVSRAINFSKTLLWIPTYHQSKAAL